MTLEVGRCGPSIDSSLVKSSWWVTSTVGLCARTDHMVTHEARACDFKYFWGVWRLHVCTCVCVFIYVCQETILDVFQELSILFFETELHWSET